ncbi:hypothetical protein BRARA_B01025 [Brassica rapa]|uniref:Secreted protein n=1 Tax=Brassica campestris TaxID=3711 RepID=A0A398A7W0_BRACM|nr:hypothetical protein BRARA_B01025 [Brassica rapa]
MGNLWLPQFFPLSIAFLSQLCSLSKTLYRGERKLLFLVRRIFSGLVSRSSGCRLWEEEASLILLHRLLFPGSISFDFSGLFRGFSGSVRSRPLVFLCSIDSRVSQLRIDESSPGVVLKFVSRSSGGSGGDLEIVSMTLSGGKSPCEKVG